MASPHLFLTWAFGCFHFAIFEVRTPISCHVALIAIDILPDGIKHINLSDWFREGMRRVGDVIIIVESTTVGYR